MNETSAGPGADLFVDPFADPFADAIALADAVLFEGYLLYPYRASAGKNQARWQWGVLLPGGVDPGSGEPDVQRVEFLAEPRGAADLRVRVRFLRLQRRAVLSPCGHELSELDVGGDRYLPFDEGVPDHQEAVFDLRTGGTMPITRAGSSTVEELIDADGHLAGRVVRTREPIAATATITVTELPGPYDTVRIRLQVGNDAAPPSGTVERAQLLPTALIATHTLLAVERGAFLSPVDPPEWAATAVRDCRCERCWAALAGPVERSDLMLCSPIIVGDHARIAPESALDLFDATENDEILTLRTMVLTEAEKAEARATDPRAAAIVDAVDALPAQMLERLHGAIRSLDPLGPLDPLDAVPTMGPTPLPASTAGSSAALGPSQMPWWDPEADTAVDPSTDTVRIGGISVSRGDTVVLRPGRGPSTPTRASGVGTDAQDTFLTGMRATVHAVVHDVDGGIHLAVSVDEDPAADLQLAHGRFRYFRPEELEVPR